jgi:hypothetical protein
MAGTAGEKVMAAKAKRERYAVSVAGNLNPFIFTKAEAQETMKFWRTYGKSPEMFRLMAIPLKPRSRKVKRWHGSNSWPIGSPKGSDQ